MKVWFGAALAALLTAATPAGARAQAVGRPYMAPVNPAPPAEQLAEMLTIYEDVCLVAFPDDAATDRRAQALGGQAMSAERVRSLLHDDPGRGFVFAGRTARFELTIENPPYHACAVRTMTASGFPDVAPYLALAGRYTAAHGRFRDAGPLDLSRDGLQILATAKQADLGGGRIDGLLVLLTQVDQAHRQPGETAVEVRFAHQIYDPARR